MRGQVSEYIVIFAAVATIAVLILSQPMFHWPYAVYDVHALIRAYENAYSQYISTFRDGAVYQFRVNYVDKNAFVFLNVGGWDATPIKSEVNAVLSHYGFKVFT